MLELEKDKGTDYVLSWKSKGIFSSKLKRIYTAFLQSIKFSGYKLGTKFDKDPLPAERNNYVTKIGNACIVYELNAWPKNTTNNFRLKNCLFGATNRVKNDDKEKWVYSGYGIAFHGAGSWNFDNDFATNVTIFGVENSSSSHTDDYKNNFF